MRPSRDTDAMKSRAHHSPNSQYNSLQRPRTTLMKQTEKKPTARVVDMEFIPKQKIDSGSLSIELPISLMDVFASGYVVTSNSNIFGDAQGGSPFPWFKPALLPIDSRLPVSLSTPHTTVSLTHATGQSPARGSATKSKGKKACQQQSRHAHLDDRCVGTKLIGRTRARLPQSPRKPSIPRSQSRRCQSRFPSDVFALRPLAALLELTLHLSLVVRRWCRAFLFDPLSMEEDFAEDVCQLVDVLRILRKSRVCRSHPISHGVRTGPPFGWVSRMFHISRNRPTSGAEMSCLRNSFSHST